MTKTVHIYSTGSCNGQTREGFARVLIERDNDKMLMMFHYHETTSKRSLMQGLIDGALELDEPCHVVLVTSSRLALEKAAVGEGPNRDLSSKGCTYTFDFGEGQGIELNKYIQAS